MKRVYLGNKELTTIATRDSGGGGGDDTQKWVDYFNGTLTEFTVPEGVTSVNPNTFVSCTGLTSLTLPSSIASIGSNDMHGGMGDETNPFGKLKAMTVKATTPPKLPDYETIIPDTIETIYVPKFSVNIYKAFEGWNSYADKIQALPQNETVVTYNDGTTKKFDIKGDLTETSIENKKAITKIAIGDNVISIGDEAFTSCSSLNGITIPESVISIGNWAFYNCSSLTSITIPNSVTSIGNSAFDGCSSLTGVIIENSTSKLKYNTNSFANISSTAKLYVPSNLLADYQADSAWSKAFKGGIYAAENSMRVTYTDGTEKTFTNLLAINQDTDSNKSNAKTVEIYDTVLSINKNAFYNCSSLTSITIPNSVTSIGELAFYNCSSLTSITIPNSVTSIWELAFLNCSSLTSITIPNSVTAICSGAFQGCSSLTSITIPNSVTSIGQSAFRDCSSITGITIPNSVTSIGNWPFENCSKLASVTIQNSDSKLIYTSNAFANISSSAKLYVPSNLLADYQADSSWSGAFKGGIFAIQ